MIVSVLVSSLGVGTFVQDLKEKNNKMNRTKDAIMYFIAFIWVLVICKVYYEFETYQEEETTIQLEVKQEGVRCLVYPKNIYDIPYILVDEGLNPNLAWITAFECGWDSLPLTNNYFGFSICDSLIISLPDSRINYLMIRDMMEMNNEVYEYNDSEYELIRWMWKNHWNVRPRYYLWCLDVLDDNPNNFQSIINNARK